MAKPGSEALRPLLGQGGGESSPDRGCGPEPATCCGSTWTTSCRPGGYDAEWTVLLDDWVDGTGRNPADILKGLFAGSSGRAPGSGQDMDGMGMGMTSPLLGGAGHIAYRRYLANGRAPTAP